VVVGNQHRLLLLVLAWGCVACASTPRGAAPSPVVLPADQATPQTTALLDEVAALRGLPWRVRPIVRVVGAAQWATLLEQHVAPDAAAQRDTGSLLASFGFLPRNPDVTALAASLRGPPVALLTHQHRVLVFPKEDLAPPAVPGGADAVAGLRVRTVALALAAQHAPPSPTGTPHHADAALAHQATLEADATLTMLAWLAARRAPTQPPLPPAALGALGLAAARLPAAQLVAAYGLPPAALHAPLPLLDAWLLPVREALALVSTALSEGGPALRNAVLASPPPTTEALLHPARYAAGDPVIPVASPLLPKDHTVLAQRSVGALGLRAVLALCHPQDLSDKAREGFGGDALVVGKNPRGGLVLVWVVTMDEERPARVVEFLLQRMDACLTRRALDGHASELGPAVATRVGSTVVFTRGLPPSVAAPLVPQWAANVGRAPVPRPPLGERTLGGGRLLDPEERARRGNVAQGRWRSVWSGLEGPVPQGFAVDLERPGVMLLLRRQDTPPAVLTLAWVRGGVDPALVDALFSSMAQRFSAGGAALSPLPRDAVPTPLGMAIRQRFVAPAAGGMFTALLVPTCGGRAGVAITLYAQDVTGQHPLESFVDGLVAQPAAPACVTP
jgi:hypothetical protein